MKKISYEAEFTAEQLKTVNELTAQTGLCEQTVRILYGRGVDTKDKIDGFLHPSARRFLSPFLMSGMKEAVELISRARDEEWSVLVYGDYDADGICASTILCRALNDFGVNANVFVPERTQGYGLSKDAIDFVFEEYFPQLFITVDCGISGAAEVDYIKEQGAEVIVTDHHELPAVLPDCICINPKIKDDYPYDNLCGAGVAFKLGCALIGKSAYSYLDFAAIATVADSVPLTGENRDLVAEGLRLINATPRPNYSEFLNKNGETVTAQNLAFSVAPKINAAGRMGDANAALKLFLSDDEKVIYDYAVKLTAYNTERQKCCDELYLSAKNKIKEKGADGRVIILWDESWNTGFVGIVAARLAEEYSRPTILFVKNGDVLKGSARSVEGVNIFEALKSCEYLIKEFGGHSQAAGVNIEQDKLQALEEWLNAHLQANYSTQAFTPTYYVNGALNSHVSAKFIDELELLEPYGVGNRKPYFTLDLGASPARSIKVGSPHLSFKTEFLDMICFYGLKFKKILQSSVPKQVIFEYNVSYYKHRKTVKGQIKDVVYTGEGCKFAGSDVAANCLLAACLPEVECEKITLSKSAAQEMIDKREEYGTVFIANDIATLGKYFYGKMEVNVFLPSSQSLSTMVLLSPQPDCDLSGYEKVVFLDNPVAITNQSLKGKKVYICNQAEGYSALRTLDCNREELLAVYKQLGYQPSAFVGESAEEVALFTPVGTTRLQFLFALKVFEELGLISFESGSLQVNRGVKTQLTNSKIYNLALRFTE